MIFISLFMISIAIIYPILNYKDRFSYTLSVQLIVMSILMVLSVLYFSKTATYQILFDTDYTLYLRLLQIRLPLNTIVQLRNMTIAVFLFLSASYIRIWRNTKWYYFAAILLPLIYLIIRYSPDTVWRIFLKQQSAQSGELIRVVSLHYADQCLAYAIPYTYLSIPFVSLILSYRKTSVTLRKNRLKLYGISIGILNLFFLFTFLNGMFSRIFFCNTNEALLPKERISSSSFSYFTQIIYILVLLFIGILLLFNRRFTSYTLINRHEIFFTSRTLEKNCNMVFHIYKNAFLGIRRQMALMQRSLSEGNYDKMENHIQLCQKIADSHLKMINKTISLLADVKLSLGPVKMSECLALALKTTPMPEQIQILCDFPPKEPLVHADEYHLTEVFKNILANAVSALQRKGHADPYIRIKTAYEEAYGILEITDNGIGIGSDKLKDIFSMFYSASLQPYSSGIGLYYVRNVITQMQGEITASSSPGNGASFKLALPLYGIH